MGHMNAKSEFLIECVYLKKNKKQNTFAHPKSLGFHFEERLQLAWGEVPHSRNWVFVIKSHSAADKEMTNLITVWRK